MTKSKSVEVAIPKARLIFPHLFEKSAIDGKFIKTEEDRKHGATLLLSKKDHAHIIKDIKDAVEDLKKHLKVKTLKHEVLKCCDEELDGIFTEDTVGSEKKQKMAYKAGHYQIQAKNKFMPVLCKTKGVPLNPEIDEDPFYPGCYVNVIIELKTYDNTFGKGISKYLKYVLFAADGERLGQNNDNNWDDYFETPEGSKQDSDELTYALDDELF